MVWEGVEISHEHAGFSFASGDSVLRKECGLEEEIFEMIPLLSFGTFESSPASTQQIHINNYVK